MSTAWLLVCMYLWTAPIPIFMSAKREMFEPPLWPGTFNFLLIPPAIFIALLCIFPNDVTGVRIACVTGFSLMMLGFFLGVQVLLNAIISGDSPYAVDAAVSRRRRSTQVVALADVLLHPSRSEGFGMLVLEAQHIGVPVITTRRGAMKDYTMHGQ